MSAVPATAPAGRYRWRVCALLLAATTINYVDRQVLGVLAPFLQDEIGWTEIEYGYIVIASLGGAPQHPQWYLNITEHPDVVINDLAERHELVARTASPEEKRELWPLAVAEWPDYDKYQESTDRDIPLVICEPKA